jgi:hypothetical protein
MKSEHPIKPAENRSEISPESMANFTLHSHSKKYSKSGDIEPIKAVKHLYFLKRQNVGCER